MCTQRVMVEWFPRYAASPHERFPPARAQRLFSMLAHARQDNGLPKSVPWALHRPRSPSFPRLMEGEHTSAGLRRKPCDSFGYMGVSLWQEDGDRRLRCVDQWTWKDPEDQRAGDH